MGPGPGPGPLPASKPGPREHRRYGAPFPYLVLGHFPDGQAATEVARRLEPLWRPVVWYTDELAILTRPGPLGVAVPCLPWPIRWIRLSEKKQQELS